MKHIVSYSGGIGSAITAELVCNAYGKDNVILLFADTLIEDEDLYRFNLDIVKLLGCEFIRISDGRTPWQVFKDVGFIGNSRIDPCSKILKRDLIKRWIRNHWHYNTSTLWVGIDASESHRLPPVVKNNLPWRYRSILVEKGIWVTPKLKLDWCTERGIELPKLYKLGFSHDNCGGFCVKAGLGQFKLLWETLPEVYLANEAEEQLAIAHNPKLKPFLQKTIKGIRYYITMKEYREKYLQTITEEESLEFGGCGCAL